MSDTRILVQVVHPNLSGSTGNRALVDAVSDLPNVTIRDLYAEYPDWKIDVAREQELLVEHDVIVFQHPLFWGSSPSLLKEWEDTVLQYGFAFPPGQGDALQDKKWLQVVTVGGPANSYSGEGKRFTIEELLRPFQSTANFCSMAWQEPFAVYSIVGAEKTDPAVLKNAAAQYRDLLSGL